MVSWSPVPEAATTPIGPRLTTLAKHSGLPLTIAVPQSGPIIRSPFETASFLRAISSSSETLSENTIVCRPASSAFLASLAA